MSYHGVSKNISKIYFEFFARGDIYFLFKKIVFYSPVPPASLLSVSLLKGTAGISNLGFGL